MRSINEHELEAISGGDTLVSYGVVGAYTHAGLQQNVQIVSQQVYGCDQLSP